MTRTQRSVPRRGRHSNTQEMHNFHLPRLEERNRGLGEGMGEGMYHSSVCFNRYAQQQDGKPTTLFAFLPHTR